MKRWLDRPPRRIGDWLVLTLAAGAVLTAVRYLPQAAGAAGRDRKSTRLNSSHP